MAFIPTPNTALAELRYVVNGEFAENTLWFEDTSPMDTGTLEDIAEMLIGWQAAEIAPLQSAECEFIGIKVTAQDTNISPVWDQSMAIPVPGSVASGAHPTNVTWSIQFATALRGRSFRGRNYVIGLPQNATTGDFILSAVAGDYVGAYNNIFTRLLLKSYEWVVVSKFTGNAPRLVGVTTPVTTVRYADLALDSQRRRLPGRGS